MKKKTFIRISPSLDGGSHLVTGIFEAPDVLKEYIDAEEGDFSVEFIKMTEKEYNELSEI